MEVLKVNTHLNFGARIKISKNKLESSLLKSEGVSAVTGGSSTIVTGAGSGADMMVHGSNNAVPAMQSSSSLFEDFAKFGHELLSRLMNKPPEHNAYDASFFSTTSTAMGAQVYSHGMNNIIKGIQKDYNNKIPT